MARYIDAENVYKEVWKRSASPLNEWDTWGVLNVLDMVKTEDVAPVIHAHWIEDGDDYICSNCNEIVFPCVSGLQMDKSLKEGKTYWNYCPHCGAKMDGKEGKK